LDATLTEIAAAQGGCRLWLVDLDRALSTEAAFSLLSAEERARFGSSMATGRHRRGVCRAALRLVLADLLACSPSRVRMTASRSGKPAVENCPELSFSVSHAGNVGVIAVVGTGSVGVDVELPRPGLGAVACARRWFSRGEAATLEQLAEAQAADGFLRCWTVKEAVVKAAGVPLAAYADRVVVEPDPSRPLRLLELPDELGLERVCVGEMSIVGPHARVAVAICGAGAVCDCETVGWCDASRGEAMSRRQLWEEGITATDSRTRRD
jgi:4'-phosphopantetheinyl transferase